MERWEPLEEDARKEGFLYPVGVDEAGRGPLAGPVVAAACYLDPTLSVPGLKDSKLLSPKKREEIYQFLQTSSKVSYAIYEVSPQEIDALNILQATFKAMLGAVSRLMLPADFLLIDGNRPPKTTTALKTVVKGDRTVQSIAAASVLAKCHRDHLMQDLHQKFPEYNLAKHKGYPTADHIKAIEKYGPNRQIHRLSFKPLSMIPS